MNQRRCWAERQGRAAPADRNDGRRRRRLVRRRASTSAARRPRRARRGSAAGSPRRAGPGSARRPGASTNARQLEKLSFRPIGSIPALPRARQRLLGRGRQCGQGVCSAGLGCLFRPAPFSGPRSPPEAGVDRRARSRFDTDARRAAPQDAVERLIRSSAVKPRPSGWRTPAAAAPAYPRRGSRGGGVIRAPSRAGDRAPTSTASPSGPPGRLHRAAGGGHGAAPAVAEAERIEQHEPAPANDPELPSGDALPGGVSFRLIPRSIQYRCRSNG